MQVIHQLNEHMIFQKDNPDPLPSEVLLINFLTIFSIIVSIIFSLNSISKSLLKDPGYL